VTNFNETPVGTAGDSEIVNLKSKIKDYSAD